MIIDQYTATKIVDALGLDSALAEDGSSVNRFFGAVFINMAERIVALEKAGEPLTEGEIISLDPSEDVEVTLDPKEWFVWLDGSDGLVHAKPYRSL